MLNPTAPEFEPASGTKSATMSKTRGLGEAEQIRAILHWQEHNRGEDTIPKVDINALLAGDFTSISSTQAAVTAVENELHETIAQRAELEKLRWLCAKLLVPDPEIKVFRRADAVQLTGYSPMLRVMAYKEDLVRLRERDKEVMSKVAEILEAEGLF